MKLKGEGWSSLFTVLALFIVFFLIVWSDQRLTVLFWVAVMSDLPLDKARLCKQLCLESSKWKCLRIQSGWSFFRLFSLIFKRINGAINLEKPFVISSFRNTLWFLVFFHFFAWFIFSLLENSRSKWFLFIHNRYFSLKQVHETVQFFVCLKVSLFAWNSTRARKLSLPETKSISTQSTAKVQVQSTPF